MTETEIRTLMAGRPHGDGRRLDHFVQDVDNPLGDWV